MRLATVKLRNFKRFTQLDIAQLPAEARLVVLVGPNGSGKTSLFEAFNFWMSQVRQSVNYDAGYHAKSGASQPHKWPAMMQCIDLRFHDAPGDPRSDPLRAQKLFYLRSAYRHEADFSLDSLSRSDDILQDRRRPTTLMSPEARVSDNYQRIVGISVESLYDPKQQDKTAREITESLLGRVRHGVRNVFDGLQLSGLGKPMEGGAFFFNKGVSSGYHYKNLSGGEKAAFDLLLDFIVKAEAFDDTIFCIDEPELHMHTRLQGRLLAELYRQLPPNCQLWISTHSIGMIRQAMEMQRAAQNEIVFLDFGSSDFDQPIVLRPARVDRRFWKCMFDVALDDLSHLIAPAQIVFCEGRREIGSSIREPAFDAYVYRQIFSAEFPDTEFVPLGGTNELDSGALLIATVLGRMMPTIRTWKLFDRDDRSSLEIEELKLAGTQVLVQRDLESYLWDDEILAKLAQSVGKPEFAAEIIEEKARLLAGLSAQGRPADDVKAIAGQLYNEVRRRLAMTGSGNSAVAFARSTLAPLVTSDTTVYGQLRLVVFGPILGAI